MSVYVGNFSVVARKKDVNKVLMSTRVCVCAYTYVWNAFSFYPTYDVHVKFIRNCKVLFC